MANVCVVNRKVVIRLLSLFLKRFFRVREPLFRLLSPFWATFLFRLLVPTSRKPQSIQFYGRFSLSFSSFTFLLKRSTSAKARLFFTEKIGTFPESLSIL